MRENVSLIFAVLVAVFILIILPLLSIMSRQDSIAYNQVLTYTTKFVDDVRLKGYFTEEDYTRYLADIASTGNTYKVEMEWRNKLFIPDGDDVYVEDTLIYYNKYINNVLESEGKVELKSNDEFYIKVYNTNITTASLLYNYFLRSNIPRKIVNIGYGGMVYSKNGKNFTQTSFASTYAPEIQSIDTVKNAQGDPCEQKYTEYIGGFAVESAYYEFDLRKTQNQKLTVNFKLQNFEKIGDVEKDDNKWNNQTNALAEAIKGKVVLTGEVASSYTKEVEIVEIKDNGDIECKVTISGISLQEGVERTTSTITIKEGLGEGSTGIVSVAGNSNEFILVYERYNPKIQIIGPLASESATTSTLGYTWDQNGKATVYFRVKGVTGKSTKLENVSEFKYTLKDSSNGEEVVTLEGTGTSQKKEGIQITVTTEEIDGETVAKVKIDFEKTRNSNNYTLEVGGTYTENRGMDNEITKDLTTQKSFSFYIEDGIIYNPEIIISGPYKSKSKESQTEFEVNKTENKVETVYFYVETTDIDTSTLSYNVVYEDNTNKTVDNVTAKPDTTDTNNNKWVTVTATTDVTTDTNFKLKVTGTEKEKVEGQSEKRTISATSNSFKYITASTFKLTGPYTNANLNTKQTTWTYSNASTPITMYFKLEAENINIDDISIDINNAKITNTTNNKEFANNSDKVEITSTKSNNYYITVKLKSPADFEGTNTLNLKVNGKAITSEEFTVKKAGVKIEGPYFNDELRKELYYSEVAGNSIRFEVIGENISIDKSSIRIINNENGDIKPGSVSVTSYDGWAKILIFCDYSELRGSNKLCVNVNGEDIYSEEFTLKLFKMNGPFTIYDYNNVVSEWKYVSGLSTAELVFIIDEYTSKITSVQIKNKNMIYDNGETFTYRSLNVNGKKQLRITIKSPQSLEGDNELIFTMGGKTYTFSKFTLKKANPYITRTKFKWL